MSNESISNIVSIFFEDINISDSLSNSTNGWHDQNDLKQISDSIIKFEQKIAVLDQGDLLNYQDRSNIIQEFKHMLSEANVKPLDDTLKTMMASDGEYNTPENDARQNIARAFDTYTDGKIVSNPTINLHIHDSAKFSFDPANTGASAQERVGRLYNGIEFPATRAGVEGVADAGLQTLDGEALSSVAIKKVSAAQFGPVVVSAAEYAKALESGSHNLPNLVTVDELKQYPRQEIVSDKLKAALKELSVEIGVPKTTSPSEYFAGLYMPDSSLSSAEQKKSFVKAIHEFQTILEPLQHSLTPKISAEEGWNLRKEFSQRLEAAGIKDITTGGENANLTDKFLLETVERFKKGKGLSYKNKQFVTSEIERINQEGSVAKFELD